MRITDRVHALRIPFTVPVAPGVEVDRFVYAHAIFGWIEDVDLQATQRPVPGFHATMNAGLAWLETIGEAVAAATAMNPSADRMELCRLVVAKLGLPSVAVNPLLAVSVEAERARVTRR